MLKWNYALNLGLVSVLALPALTGQGQGASLEQALSDTERALAHLAAIEARVQRRDPLALELVRSATEAASGEARARDARLERLRVEVAALEMQRDALAAGTSAAPPPAPAGGELAPIPPAPTTGLDDALRRELSRRAPDAPASATDGSARAASASAPIPADPLRQAQALYRAGRYQECLARTETLEPDPTARYWGARALERLGREQEALERYRSLSARADAGWVARRAGEDAAYLEWKLARAKRAAPAGAPEAVR